MPDNNYVFRKYNKKNWRTGVVHKANPIWETWKDVPEDVKDRMKDMKEKDFYKSACGVESTGGYRQYSKMSIQFQEDVFGRTPRFSGYETLCLVTLDRSTVTCKRCLKTL